MAISSRGWVAVVAILWLLVTTSCSNDFAPTTVSGMPFLVTSQANQTVISYEMDTKSGQLTPNGTPFSTGTGGVPNASIIVGGAAFVANGGTNDIARFALNADATLSPVAGNQPAGTNPIAMAVDPTGKFLFVANQGDQTVTSFRVSGANLAVTGVIPTAPDPVALAISPANNYLYVANSISGTISGYTYDTSSGVLSPMSQAPFSSVGSTPSALAITTDGKFLFVANSGSNDVAGFTICTAVNSICPSADGSLVPYPHAPYLAGISPRSMAISLVNPSSGSCDPTGCSYYLFVADEFSNQVSMFTAVPAVDPITGLTTDQLKDNNPSVVSTGTNPVSIVIPSNGNFVFVANNGSASVTSFVLRPDGILLANGEVATGGKPSALATK